MLGFFVFAATTAVVSTAPAQCEIRSEKRDGTLLLAGLCGTASVSLGRASSYESVIHSKSGAVAVVIERNSETHVLVLRSDAEGAPVLEEVTGDIARKAGLLPQVGLAGFSLDLSRFPENGIINASRDDLTGRASTGPIAISLEAIIAGEAARQSLPPPQLKVVEVSGEPNGSTRK